MAESESEVTSSPSLPSVVELNVGGVVYATSLTTLTKQADTLLARMFAQDDSKRDCVARPMPDSKGRFFIDRDGVLFRYVLDFLRSGKLILPENFHERDRLRCESDYFLITAMTRALLVMTPPPSSQHQLLCATNSAPPVVQEAEKNGGVLLKTSSDAGKDTDRDDGYITVGYRGTFAYGRDGVADVKFRKMNRILVCGRVSLCRRVFGETLNESRDPDRGPASRYTSRFFLKHLSLEHAFDTLQLGGFRLVASCASGTSTSCEYKTGMDTEENKWYHYNEFVFCRP